MLKTVLTIFTLGLVLLAAGPAFAQRGDQSDEYQPDIVYTGIYKTGVLYQYNPWKKLWYVSTEHRKWENLACREARRELRRQGTWVGNLGLSGECLGKAEAPTWATGNYLNYKVGR